MRLIDADAVLHEISTDAWDNHPLRYTEQEARNLIEQAPTIAPRHDWTPCAEGLPAEAKMYRVIAAYYQRGIVKDVIDDLWYYGNGEWQKYDDAHKVIAWKPLRADDTTGKVKED